MDRELTLAPDCIYNSAVRTRICGWYHRSVIAGVSASYALLVVTGSLTPEVRWTLVAALVTLLVGLSNLGRCSAELRIAAFGEELRNRLGVKYAKDLSEMVHIGYTPCRDPRSYSGDKSWDVGFLAFGAHLEYFGDQQHWRLLPSEILRVKVCGYYRPRLLLQFQTRFGSPKWICLEPRIAGSNTARYAHLQLIRIRIAMLGGSAKASGVEPPQATTA